MKPAPPFTIGQHVTLRGKPVGQDGAGYGSIPDLTVHQLTYLPEPDNTWLVWATGPTGDNWEMPAHWFEPAAD